MRLEMLSEPGVDALEFRVCDLGFIGRSVDDRGDAATEFIKSRCKDVRRLTFDPPTQALLCDGALMSLQELESLVDGRDIIAEATTLGFVELFLLVRARHARCNGCFELVYAEPKEYDVPRGSRRTYPFERRDFNLSANTYPFSAVPTASLLITEHDPVRAAFLVGYEGSRLESVLEDLPLNPRDCALVFGVPAFQPGWEMNAFANNIQLMDRAQIPRLLYAGAQNPLAAYHALADIHKGAPEGRLLIGPIGTKPHGIGAALYACLNEGVGLVYDHPVKSKRRSTQVAVWHRFIVVF